jgi:PAS domain S-box-containing protein
MMGNEGVYLNVSELSTPCLYISAKDFKIGMITNCNQSVCRIFGHFKGELIGKNLNILMPDLFTKYHQRMLELKIAYNFSDKSIINLQKSVIAKHKSGSIFPINMKIVSTPSLWNDVNFIAIFSHDHLSLKSDIGYLLLDTEFHIVACSSSKMLSLSS